MLKLVLGCALAALALILSTAKVTVAAEISLLTVSLLAAALGLVILTAKAAGEPKSGHMAA